MKLNEKQEKLVSMALREYRGVVLRTRNTRVRQAGLDEVDELLALLAESDRLRCLPS